MRKHVLSFVGLAAGAYVATTAIARLRAKRFDGQVVVITGGSRGLGLAIAREFARRGAKPALLARDPDELARAKHAFDVTHDVFTFVCDVRDAEDVLRAVDATVAHFGRIDVLVNNAGTIAVGPIETMTREDYTEAMDTHFWGTYNTVEAVWPMFTHSGAGSIVNITSIGGRVSVPHLLPYSASKFAQVGYSEGLRAEARRFGITVTTVAPGLMRTGSPRNAWFKGNNEAEYGWFAVSDALPLLSVSARYAARRIVDACARGEANVSIGPSAFLATRLHGLSPGVTARAMEIAAALLPHASQAATRAYQGRASETGITESPLTELNRNAEREYNQR